MKKRWFLIITLLILILFIGWFLSKKRDVDVSTDSKLRIAVSIPLLGNLAEEIGRDEVAVTSIIKGASCNHEYEPASGDMKNVSHSAVFIKVGMGFDLWADKLIAGAAENVLVIDASQGITAIKDEVHAHDDEDGDDHEAEIGNEAEHHHHELGNPHYWGNPEHVKIMAKNILNGLVQVLPEKKDYFTRNYREYLSRIDQTVSELQSDLAKIPSKKIISYSAAFPYFYQYFGFDNLVTVENTCEQEVSPKRLAEVITLARANQIEVIVGEAVYPNLPENLAKETGAKLVLLWPNTNETGDYLDTLTENVEKLVAALQ